jgi:hypothetical protein
MVLSGRSIDTGVLFFTAEEQRKNQEAEAAAQQAQASLIQADTLSANADQLTQTLGV